MNKVVRNLIALPAGVSAGLFLYLRFGLTKPVDFGELHEFMFNEKSSSTDLDISFSSSTSNSFTDGLYVNVNQTNGEPYPWFMCKLNGKTVGSGNMDTYDPLLINKCLVDVSQNLHELGGIDGFYMHITTGKAPELLKSEIFRRDMVIEINDNLVHRSILIDMFDEAGSLHKYSIGLISPLTGYDRTVINYFSDTGKEVNWITDQNSIAPEIRQFIFDSCNNLIPQSIFEGKDLGEMVKGMIDTLDYTPQEVRQIDPSYIEACK